MLEKISRKSIATEHNFYNVEGILSSTFKKLYSNVDISLKNFRKRSEKISSNDLWWSQDGKSIPSQILSWNFSLLPHEEIFHRIPILCRALCCDYELFIKRLRI